MRIDASPTGRAVNGIGMSDGSSKCRVWCHWTRLAESLGRIWLRSIKVVIMEYVVIIGSNANTQNFLV